MKRRLPRGFSLLEVLVAFAILSLALTTLFSLFGGAVRSSAVARDYQQALLLAETQLAYLQGVNAAQLQAASTHGETSGGFSWRSEVTPLEQELPVVAGVTLYRLAVQIHWQESGRARQLELTTLRLGQTP